MHIEDSLKTILKRFRFTKTKAAELIKDQNQAQATVNKAWKKANHHKTDLQAIWDQVQLLFSLVKDYFKGRYTQIPIRSLTAILAGILYFLSPMDAIPDFMLGFGMIDDVFILSLVLKQVYADLEKYRIWKEAR